MKKIKNRQIAAVLLILAIVITQIPPSLVKAQQSDFVVDKTTLISYEGADGEVTIPNYIKKIGRGAFENNGSLVRVQIPSSVETIEAGAFARCRNLTSVSVPASVTDIAPSAFAGCDRLAAVSIDSQNPSYLCENGTIMNKKRTRIVQVLAGKAGNSYQIGRSIEQIDRYAFWGCDNITDIQIAQGLGTISAYAFSNMPNLSNVSIPETVREIEMKAFEDCTSLKELYLSPSVVTIHPTAFDGCRRLHISSLSGSAADRFYQEFTQTNVILQEEEDDGNGGFFVEPQQFVNVQAVSVNGTQSQSSTAQTGNPAEESRNPQTYETANVDHPANAVYRESEDGAEVLGRTKIVGGRAVVFIDNSKLKVQTGETKTSSQPQQTQTDPATGTQSISSHADTAPLPQAEMLPEEEGTSLNTEIPNTKYVVVGDMIADRAFYREQSLDGYQIPAGVKRIGDFAFARSSLQEIRIPGGVTQIGYGAFYNCANLTSVSIPSSVTDIEPSAFADTAWMRNWVSGGNLNEFLIVGDGILLAYKGMTENVTVPEGVKVIGPEAFKNHTEIRTVSLPDSVKRIDEEAFSGCGMLENVAGGSSVEAIKDRAFYGCSLKTVRIPESVRSIGLLAFGNMPQTDSVVFLSGDLPKISYEKTATRLNNAEYRKSPFEGIHVFVVPSTASDFDGTVLKSGALGYDGVICSVIREPTLQAKGEVSVHKVSVDDSGLPAQIPQSIWLYGKEYYVTNTETDAFDTMQPESGQVTLDGEVEEQPEVSAAEAGQEEDAGNGEQSDSARNGNLQVQVRKEAWKENTGIYADMTADGEGYELVLSEDDGSVLKQQLSSQGISTDGFNFTTFDMKLIDLESKIPITRLGSQSITVSLPVAKVYQSEPVVAVSLDGNGQIEYIPCIHHMTDDQAYVLFDVKHFSPYALLCGDQVPGEYKDAYYEKVAAKKAAGYDSNLGKKDESPDTGDYMEPKWFLAAGIFFLAVFFFIKKPRKEA